MCTKSSSQVRRGMILVDVLVAMSMVAFFVSIFSAATIYSRQSFDRAHNRMGELMSSSTFATNASVDNLSVPLFIPASNMPVCSTDFRGGYSSEISTSSVPIIKTINLPISPTTPLTHLEVRGGLAFVSADSNISADPDIFVFNIPASSTTLSATATLVSSINTGPGIAPFALVGNRIFAGAASTAAQLHVINFGNLVTPFLEDKYRLPPPYATATLPYATAVSFGVDLSNYAGYVYLGTDKWEGDEFSVIDVTNPVSPTWINGLNVDSKINDIQISSDTKAAYIANAGQAQLIQALVNGVPSGSELNIEYGFSPSGWSRQEGKAVSLHSSRLLFGRTSGGYDISSDHELFSWATTSGTLSSIPYLSQNIPGGVYGIVQDDARVYIATRQIGKEFQVFDTTMATSTLFMLPTQPQSMTCDGDIIYVLSHTSSIIYAISF